MSKAQFYGIFFPRATSALIVEANVYIIQDDPARDEDDRMVRNHSMLIH